MVSGPASRPALPSFLRSRRIRSRTSTGSALGGLVGAVVEDGRGDRLGRLEQSDDRFHRGVGVGIAHGADRGSDALQLEVLVNRMDVYWLPASEWCSS
jgi:hypothetical protein